MTRCGLAVQAALVCAVAAGADEAHFRMPTSLAARVETGERSRLHVGAEPDNGNTLVSVSQAIHPFIQDVMLPLSDPEESKDPEALRVPPGFTAPRALAARLTSEPSALEALHQVVAYVSRQIRLEERDSGPQDAASVLRRGRGRCSGRANLAVGLLRVFGIPARTVHGVVADRGGTRWHRWGEAWLGELGWVPFDPGASVGAVNVRYLPMTGASDQQGRPPVQLVALDETVFAELPRRDGLRVVPRAGVTLRCAGMAATEEYTVVLIHPGGRRWFKRGRGEVEFAGVMPGRYRLMWTGETGGGAMELSVGAAGVVHVRLTAGQEGAS